MAAESQITATPAHEISISSKLRPTLAQCSCRTRILLWKTAGEPNVFQISACLATTFRVIFSPAAPMRIGGGGLCTRFGSHPPPLIVLLPAPEVGFWLRP